MTRAQPAWRTLTVGEWFLTVGPRVRGRCWLLVYRGSIVAAGHSFRELLRCAIRNGVERIRQG